MANVSSSNSQEVLVPKLRFPGFEGEWERHKLSDIAERVTRKNSNNESDLPLTISSKDGLVDQISFFNKTVASKDMSGYYLLKNGEFAYNKSYSVGYDFGSIKRLDRYPMGALSTLYICFALKENDSDFMKIYFDSLKWYKEIYMIAAEGARNHGLLNVPTEDFFSTKHIIPTDLTEQRKIANFLTLIEARVEKQRQLIEALKSYKRGLLFAVFRADNKFGIPMSLMPMKSLLTEYRIRETAGLRVCSVAVEKGVVDQIEHLGRSFSAADTSKYGRVEPNYVIYTKSPTGEFPYGIVKQNRLSESVAVSPLYGVYIPRSVEDGTLLHYYFEQPENANNYIRTLAQKGAKNTINITTDRFLDKDILFPTHSDDIQMLVSALDTLDKSIKGQNRLLDSLNKERYMLLSQMFI